MLKNDEKFFSLEFFEIKKKIIRHVLWYLKTLFSTLEVSKGRIGGKKPKCSCAKEMYHFSIFVLCSTIQGSIMKIFKMNWEFSFLGYQKMDAGNDIFGSIVQSVSYAPHTHPRSIWIP